MPAAPDPPTVTLANPLADPLADPAVVRATFESAPDGIVVVSSDGRVLAWNPQFQALWNFPADMLARRDAAEMRRHTASQLQDPQAYLHSLARLGQIQEVRVFDAVALADGRVFERHVAPIDAPGAPGALTVRWRDITTRHRAEAALAQSQARLAALFQHALNAILLASDDALYLDANPAACSLLGYTRDELVGRPVAEVVVPGRMDTASAWAAFLQAGQARGRVQLRHRDGSLVEAQFNAVARVLPGVHLSVLSDVTEELHAQQRQEELTALLDLAMMDADLAFWDADLATGRIQSVNSHWLTMLGYAPGDVEDSLSAWDRLVHGDDQPARVRAWLDHLRGRTSVYTAEFRMRHKRGHWVWIQGRGRVVARAEDGRALRVVGLRMDISARKQAEARLEGLAHTDALTGLLNRRRFFELATAELAPAQRRQAPMALLMLDLDHFKAVNDRLGHAGGDAVLRAFAATAQGVMRQGDLLGRVGGEEFAVLLPRTGQAGALALARRLRQQVQDRPARVGGQPVPCTVSIGLAVLPATADGTPAADSVDSLMAVADRALYLAKGQGRNRVVLGD